MIGSILFERREVTQHGDGLRGMLPHGFGEGNGASRDFRIGDFVTELRKEQRVEPKAVTKTQDPQAWFFLGVARQSKLAWLV